MTSTSDRDFSTGIGRHWLWFLVLGVVLLVFGVIAAGNLFVASVASTYWVGILMIAAAVAEIVHAFAVSGWGNKIFAVLAGILYGIAGYYAFTNPLVATATLTLMLGAFLLATGLIRMWIGFRERDVTGWGWIVFGGAVTALAGLLILMGWPGNSIWVLGLFLAVDLMVSGLTYILFALGLKKI